jgi:hypothetical protein
MAAIWNQKLTKNNYLKTKTVRKIDRKEDTLFGTETSWGNPIGSMVTR